MEMLGAIEHEARRSQVEAVAYDLTKKATEFIRENDLKDLVILDRSARPFATAFITYWNLAHKDEKKPGIYFINPDAFTEKKQPKTCRRSLEKNTDFYLKTGKSRFSFLIFAPMKAEH